MLAPWKKTYDQHGQHIKKQIHYFADRGPSSQSYGFSSTHVWMRELDHKECWALKSWCFWTVVLEKTLESPWTTRRSNQSILKEINWIFIGRTEAEAPILWLPDVKNWLIRKDPDAGKDWKQEGKGTTEDEMVGWHHQLDGHEFEQTPGVGDGHRSLACCSPRVANSWTWQWLTWTEMVLWQFLFCSWVWQWHFSNCLTYLAIVLNRRVINK